MAMLFVIMYHLYCTDHYYSFFRFGYLGVDIFLFFSGFGLCFSYEKNTRSKFYANRLIRIYPLCFVWAFVHLLFLVLNQDMHINTIDIIGLFSTLSYYGWGSIRSNWYLSALIFLYICFPLLFSIVRKFREVSVVFFLAISLIILSLFNLEWYYDCFISLFSPFVFGIYYFSLLKHSKHPNVLDNNNRICLHFFISY